VTRFTRRGGRGLPRQAGAHALLWFRRNLHLGDHPALLAACDSAEDGDVLPVFVFDDR
jgi:deoxyribodipyrimidine photolyase